MVNVVGTVNANRDRYQRKPLVLAVGQETKSALYSRQWEFDSPPPAAMRPVQHSLELRLRVQLCPHWLPLQRLKTIPQVNLTTYFWAGVKQPNVAVSLILKVELAQLSFKGPSVFL